jgi:PAS domain S-box-containing protein
MYSVLYVDDEPELLEIGQTYLQQRWGMKVTTASSANEALLRLKIKNYDIIISDYQMPEMDGINFLKYLRNNNFTEPFILFTGKGREEVIIEALNSGADFYLQKGGQPMAQFSELVNMITKAVEKKRGEIERQRVNNQLISIINHLPDPTFVVDDLSQIKYWNHALEKMTGIMASETIGKDANDCFALLFGKEYLPLVNIIINSTPEDGLDVFNDYKDNTITAEREIIDFSGKKRTVWIKVSPIYSEDKKITGAIETLRDITDIKENEIQLCETSQFLQNIIDFIPDPTFVIDTQGRVIAWNHAIKDMTGIVASDIIGKGDYVYAIPIYSEKRPLLIDLLFDENPIIKQKYDFVKKEGNKLIAEVFCGQVNNGKGAYLWAVAAPLFDTHGNLKGGIESFRDISIRKELETELLKKYEDLATSYEEISAQNEEIQTSFEEISEQKRLLSESECRFRSLVEQLPDGVIIHKSGLIQYVNSMGVKILGYNNPKELNNIPILDIVHPDHRGDINNHLQDIPNSSKPFFEELFLRKDGTEVPVEVAGFPIQIEESKSMITIFRDVTIEYERKIALIQAKNKLNLLSSITRHDIRNQMTCLMSVVDLITEEENSDSRVLLLKKASAFCQNIFEELQTSFEYQTLGIEEPHWFNIKLLVMHAIKIHQITEESFSYNCKNVEIYADPLIGKVIENLIDNSMRHGKKTQNIFFITNYVSDHLQFIYGDDGGGIPDEEKECIFQERYGKHSGLGLFLITEILAITGFTIKECGIYGEGVRFEIDIPPGKWRIISPSISSN